MRMVLTVPIRQNEIHSSWTEFLFAEGALEMGSRLMLSSSAIQGYTWVPVAVCPEHLFCLFTSTSAFLFVCQFGTETECSDVSVKANQAARWQTTAVGAPGRGHFGGGIPPTQRRTWARDYVLCKRPSFLLLQSKYNCFAKETNHRYIGL